MARTKVKITITLLSTSHPLTYLLAICQQTARKSTGGEHPSPPEISL
jgi:hypothetical protein